MKDIIVCSPKSLPAELLVRAARTAVEINPHNHPPVEHLTRIIPAFQPTPQRIALLTKKYWGVGGVRLTVSFLDNPPSDLRKRILQHMNAWSKTANVKFVETKSKGQVRIARDESGYWSYLGTDILHIPLREQTMNLQEFTMNIPESEYHRVVRHETGHTLGFPHEHMRKQLVDKIDPEKAIAYFEATQGWSEEEVRAQVLTPIEESSLRTPAPHNFIDSPAYFRWPACPCSCQISLETSPLPLFLLDVSRKSRRLTCSKPASRAGFESFET